MPSMFSCSKFMLLVVVVVCVLLAIWLRGGEGGLCSRVEFFLCSSGFVYGFCLEFGWLLQC